MDVVILWLLSSSSLVNRLSFVCASSVLKVSRTPPVIIPNLALRGEDEGRRKQSKCSKYSWMKKGKSSVLLILQNITAAFCSELCRSGAASLRFKSLRSLQMSLGNPGFPSDESPAQRNPLPFVRCDAVTPGAVSGFDLVPTRISVCSAGDR